jgi:hypothetical protein
MNDDVLKILLTESDVNLIMNALTFFASEFDNDGDGFTGALELHDDLLEQVARHDDPEWDLNPGHSFTVAEDDMIQRGMDAREQAKMHSHAAMRRKARQFGEFEVVNSLEMTPAQRHDVFEIATEEELERDDPTEISRRLCGNDPIAW